MSVGIRPLWVVVVSVLLSASLQAQTTIQILHASDLEGGVDAIEAAPNFAAVVQALENDAASMNVPSILLSSGDNYIPGPFFSAAGDPSVRNALRTALGRPQVREREGRADIAIMNILGFDASALGNHEFDLGTPAMREILGPDIRDTNNDGIPDDARWFGTDFPMLSANLDFSGDPNLLSLFEAGLVNNTAFKGDPGNLSQAANRKKIAAAAIIERNGEKFGVIGATTPLLEQISSPGLTRVKNPGAGTNNMNALASILQPVINSVITAGVNKIILVAHLQQIALEQQLVPLLSGVDIAIAGGSDTLLADNTDPLYPGDVPAGPYPIVTTNLDGDPAVIVNTDGKYSYVGRLVITFDAQGKIDVSSIDEVVSGIYKTDNEGVEALWGNLNDPFLPGTKGARVRGLVNAVRGVVIAKDSNVFGHSKVFLEGRRQMVRTEETNLGNLTADANLWMAKKTDPTTLVSLKNGGGIRDFIGFIDGYSGALLPTQANPLSGKQATQISQLDIENTLRFNNGLTLVTTTAAGLLQLLEHGVAATGPGMTPGQFPQVGGLAFSFDASRPAGSRVRSAAIKDANGNTLDVLKKDFVMVGDPTRSIRMVTLNFLANGGDAYPFNAVSTERVELLSAGPRTGSATFADNGSEQDALAEYLAAFHADPAKAFGKTDTPTRFDGRIQNLAVRSDTAAYPPSTPGGTIKLSLLGRYETGIFNQSAAEITAFDPGSQRLFLINANTSTLEILDLAAPSAPALIDSIDIQGLFSDGDVIASPNSVAVKNGLVVVAVQRSQQSRQLDGIAAFFDIGGQLLDQAPTGALPDMITFTPDGRYVLTADEGEPSNDYSFDPEGTVTIIGVNWPSVEPTTAGAIGIAGEVRQATFGGFNGSKDALRAKGVRIFGPNATVAQDVEPEYIAVSDDSKTAYVTLQENNAMAVVDIDSAQVLNIEPLGYKDWSASALDSSDRDNAINIRSWPVFGIYQPDAVAAYRLGGDTYLVTANEGDARDYSAFSEEVRVSSRTLDPTAFPNAASLRQNANLGRLTITNTMGDTDGDGDYDKLYTLGGRSFSIWRVTEDGTLEQVYDSGDDMERITAAAYPAYFNCNHAENNSFDTRSDNKGPEPEGVVIGQVNGRAYAFIGLERIGGVMVYDITNPNAPAFVQYINTRDFSASSVSAAGDLGPEGLEFVAAADSPTGKPLLIVAHEVSGTVAIFEVTQLPAGGSFLWGDLNGDGKANAVDAVQVLQFDAGLRQFFPLYRDIRAPLFPPAADVNGSGKLNALDAALLLRFDAFLLNCLPADLNCDGIGPN